MMKSPPATGPIKLPMLLGAALAVVIAACSGGVDADGVVGAACRDDRDCAERCETGGDFPGGFCTVRCIDDGDCPSDTYCVDTHGGVCLFACDVNEDCDFLGRAYQCRDKDDFADRPIAVCFG